MAAWLLACGTEPADAPSPSSSPATTPSPAPSPAPSPSTATSPASAPPPSPADPADCDRVRACAEAFAALAPAELAGPARVAADQLDHSLADSPARAAACTAAIASFRADLERLELEVPESCR